MPNLADVTAVLISDLSSIPEIASNFEEIFVPPRREFRYPALMLDLIRVDLLNEKYYGFYDLNYLFTIFVKQRKREGLRLLDILISKFNKFSSYNDTFKIAYVAEYNSGYNDLFDLDSGIIAITTAWKVRTIFKE